MAVSQTTSPLVASRKLSMLPALHFLNLPAEVRLEIYRQILTEDDDELCSHRALPLFLFNGSLVRFDRCATRWGSDIRDPVLTVQSFNDGSVPHIIFGISVNLQVYNEVHYLLYREGLLFSDGVFGSPNFRLKHHDRDLKNPNCPLTPTISRFLSKQDTKIFLSVKRIGFTVLQPPATASDEWAAAELVHTFKWIRSNLPNLQTTHIYVSAVFNTRLLLGDSFLACLANAMPLLPGEKLVALHGTPSANRVMENKTRRLMSDQDLSVVKGCYMPFHQLSNYRAGVRKV